MEQTQRFLPKLQDKVESSGVSIERTNDNVRDKDEYISLLYLSWVSSFRYVESSYRRVFSFPLIFRI